MTESARPVARQPLAALPAYPSRDAKRADTRPQRSAALAARQSLEADSRGAEPHLRDWAEWRAAAGLGDRVPDHTTLQRAAARRLKTSRPTPSSTRPSRAAPPADPRQARAGRPGPRRRWPKLSAVADCHTHLLPAAVVTRGPGPDGGPFRAAVGAAAARVPRDTSLGDAAFDAERYHEYARRDLGVRSTVFPVYRRGGGPGPGEVPRADGPARPAAAGRPAAPPGVRPAVAGGERVPPAQAAARVGAAGQALGPPSRRGAAPGRRP